MGRDDDAEYGLTPREWLESDAVPASPDMDLSDPAQFSAWAKANNEEMRARWLELQSRREHRTRGRVGEGDSDRDGGSLPRTSATTVVGVRLLNAEQRALVRAARREDLTVSDLVRRWVRAGLADDVEPGEVEAQREALGAAADAIVGRIADEVRRLREIVVSGG